MVSKTNWKSWVIVALAVAVFATAGGLVMASNMGFKINKQLFPGFILAQAPKRDNWVSLPYSNPYPDAKKLCVALGTSAATFTITQLNPSTGGTLVNYLCSLSTVVALDPTRGIRIRNTGTTPTNGVLVGSSNESQALPTMLGGFVLSQAPKKDNWISVPYHTTWVKAEDVCVTMGLGTGTGSVVRINADPAATNLISHPCGGTVVNNFSLVIGEAVSVRKTAAGDITGKLPPHF